MIYLELAGRHVEFARLIKVANAMLGATNCRGPG